MARIAFFVIFTTSLLQSHARLGFTEVKCTPKHTGVVGQQSVLECVVGFKEEIESPRLKEVMWRKKSENAPLLHFIQGKETWTSSSRYKFAEPSWDAMNMNVSLLISDTEVADEDTYSCLVVTDGFGQKVGSPSLHVKSKYKTPTVRSNPEEIALNTNSDLICHTEGGYPKGTLQWFDDQKGNWTGSAKMEVRRMDNGLISLTSQLSLLSGSTLPKYTCAVYNGWAVKESEVTFDMPLTERVVDSAKSSEVSKIVAPVVIIGSMIVGLLLVLVFCKKCSLRRQAPRSEEMMETGDLLEMKTVDNTQETS